MRKAKNVFGWTVSPSMVGMLFPKIHYECQKCGQKNSVRVLGRKKKVPAVCGYCGDVNKVGM